MILSGFFKKLYYLLSGRKKKYKQSIVLFLSGPSGVGKTTIENELLHNHNINWHKVKSTTTRQKRNNAIDDQFYNFVSVRKFKRYIKKGSFLFWMESSYAKGVFYGFTNAAIFGAIRQKCVVLLNAHSSAMKTIKNKLSNMNTKFISIFLLPPSIRELENRIISRGSETKAEINRRLRNAKNELAYSNRYDYQIINENPIIVGKIINRILIEAIDEVNGLEKDTKKHDKALDKSIKLYVKKNRRRLC
jgi:guanylate kinase